jgi:hypothetical protein
VLLILLSKRRPMTPHAVKNLVAQVVKGAKLRFTSIL